MRPLVEISPGEIKNIEFILTDIDDTLTEEGKLVPEAFIAMWKLYEAGFKLIPVTGRPAGWCDMIIRQWPVDAVVGENGAFVYYGEERNDGGPYKTFIHPSVAGGDIAARLEKVEKEVFKRVPGVRRAKDQPFRIYDLAIDFREDSPKFGLDTAGEVAEVCREMGAEAKISSIHVNTWFGSYDKLDTTLRFLEELRGLGRQEAKSRVFFCGDSPNDEPMFSFFPLSCGVANVRDYLSYMKSLPSYVSEKACGGGFAEVVDVLVKPRGHTGRNVK
ncbi:MAG: HAD family hydrolase [Spirochaetia bacterium]